MRITRWQAVVLSAVVMLLALGAGLWRGRITGEDLDMCRYRYAAARSPLDSLAVDSVVAHAISSRAPKAAAMTCGDLRRASRL